MSDQTNTNATQFGTIAQNIAPYGVMMAILHWFMPRALGLPGAGLAGRCSG